ncbi:NAD(P)/FAD-dependent oxidoreductase [Winogradskyella sp. PE311]|uniref:NAD(P)/FAD-dependent oxidoreductase n=1 Tax=Winogradskyella sp. PE311 TaxID=3366943 RepID=UPI00397EA668
MNLKSYKIHIVGSGISGLIAAKTLEAQGFAPKIIEATSRVGGRVKTDLVNNYQLDHGFQVLLESYPEAKKHLDYEVLSLQKFKPGAVIFKNGKSQTIGDPLRDFSLFFPTLKATVGTLNDKLKILKLNTSLKRKSIEDIFESENKSTFQYLKEKGFSDGIISDFFKPFFSGIFLEPNLETSSRMFEFVYKMFGEGLAVLPKEGIGVIAEHLLSQLNQTKIFYNSKVKSVTTNNITLENGEQLDTDYTIIATEPNLIVPDLERNTDSWKSCYNLYFEVKNKVIKGALIGLISDANAIINNICYCNNSGVNNSSDKQLLSVTVVKPIKLSEKELVKQVESELQQFCNISTSNFVKMYHIKKALPDLEYLRADIDPKDTKLKSNIFLAGDYLLNGSLNAAMISGERAAEGVLESVKEDRLLKT